MSMMQLPAPGEVKIPTPIQGNSGKYMCPFTSDDTVAEWVDKGANASLGSAIGSTAGSYAGQKACEQIPFVGAWLGNKVGGAVGRATAIKMSGGEAFIKETSDLSFNEIDNLCVYIYAKHSSHHDYAKVQKLTSEIYPKVKKRYLKAIQAARLKNK
jgi:hypothetical protein